MEDSKTREIIAQEYPVISTGSDPQIRHYVRFAKTPEQLASMLEVAQAVDIPARAITDPEEAASAYSALAVEQIEMRRREFMYPMSEHAPAWHADTAHKRVSEGGALVLFTSDAKTAMTPFIEEYDRRFGAAASREL
jgi:hypothetical protein